MTTRTSQIPSWKWAQHEAKIKELYLDRGLPVKSKTGKDDLVGIMNKQWGFSATPAQYETWINQQGLSKNFSKAETRLVICILDQLQAQGFKARALDSGKEIKVDKLKRKRRYAVNTASGCSGAVLTQELPPRITIEIFEAANDKWIPYQSPLPPRGDQSITLSANEALVPSQSTGIFPVAPLVPMCPGETMPLRPSVLRGSSPSLSTIIRYSPAMRASPEAFPNLDVSETRNVGNLIDWMGTSSAMPSFLVDFQFTLYHTLPFYQIEQTLRQRQPQMTGIGMNVVGTADVTTRQTSQALTLASPRSWAGSLVQHAHQVVADLEHDLDYDTRSSLNAIPDPETLLDRLQSLLPEDEQQDTATQSTEVLGHDIVDSVFHKALLYSIVNGFAGLQDLPRGAVLRMLRGDQYVSRRLFELVQRCPPSLAKSFAENVFKAAVEGRDARAVEMIAHAVRDTPNAIKPDEMLCELEGRKYTPIELAALFRDLDMIQMLLRLGVDVNRNYYGYGALHLAIDGDQGRRTAVDMRIPRVLLAAGANVGPRLVEDVLKRHRDELELHRELLGQLLPRDHQDYFRLLPKFARHLANALAHETIQWVFRQCVAAKCRQCPTSERLGLATLVRETLAFAAERGNMPLCKLLLKITRADDDALAAAIRGGEQEAIALLLEHGAMANAAIPWTSRTTPLAEAIRRQDNDLLQELEKRGAWSQLDQVEDYLMAAVEAAAQVGNLHLLGRVLQAAPQHSGSQLAKALICAIDHGHTQAALMLLNAGASTQEIRNRSDRGNALISAIRQQNAPLVDVLLESEVDVNSEDNENKRTVLDYAVEWGNLPVIDDLIFMGADIDGGVLCQAVGSRNTALVARLLDFGATPNRLSDERHDVRSPLEVAVKNADTEMMHLLLSRGANPADEEVLVAAMNAGNSMLGTLLGAFRKQHPYGIGGFGGLVVIEAIEANNEDCLRDLISAKMDVVRLRHQPGWYYYYTPLASAIRHGRKSMVQKLLAAGADVNGTAAAASRFSPPVEHDRSFFWRSESPLLMAIETGSEDMTRLLIDGGALVNYSARKGFKRTPLQKACEVGSFEMVKLLLDLGADVNSLPAVRGGGTALQLAAATGSIKIASYLLECGALVHAPTSDVNGRAVLEAAAEKGRIDMIKLLWDAAYPTGYSADQVQKALDFATKEGHVSCADYIRFLSGTSAESVGRMPSSQVMEGGTWTGWN